jgi:hypothetical protein
MACSLLEDWIIYANAEIVAMLLKHGADPERVSMPSKNTFYLAFGRLSWSLMVRFPGPTRCMMVREG